ncbi:MAG: sigma-70 family RNA polymerase sigma factor [Fimbriimonadaceae bacterium]|nr:sigma-70 family RNA polymerase sigma factor [Fimbriimonadaceae bacterium]
MAPGKKIDAASEQALLEQVRGQDLDAFSKIVDAYQARIYGFVKRMVRSDEEALDISQEVFIRAFQAVDRFDGRSGLRTWLFRIAHNLCVDRARRNERAPSFVSLEPTESDDGPREVADERWNPEHAVLQDELRDVVDAALATMSEKLRTVLLLHDKEDMGYEEISKTVDVPVGTVKSRLFLARAHLQEHVGQYLAKR